MQCTNAQQHATVWPGHLIATLNVCGYFWGKRPVISVESSLLLPRVWVGWMGVDEGYTLDFQDCVKKIVRFQWGRQSEVKHFVIMTVNPLLSTFLSVLEVPVLCILEFFQLLFLKPFNLCGISGMLSPFKTLLNYSFVICFSFIIFLLVHVYLFYSLGLIP